MSAGPGRPTSRSWSRGVLIWLVSAGLVMAVCTLSLVSWASRRRH